MSTIGVIAYQSAVLKSYRNDNVQSESFTESMKTQLKASKSLQELSREVQERYPEGAKLRISGKGVFVQPKEESGFIPFVSKSQAGVLQETKDLRNFERLMLQNLKKASSDYTESKVFKPITSKESKLTSKIAAFSKNVLGYTPSPKVVGNALGSANYLSGARYVIETVEGYRDFRNAQKLGDVTLMSEKAFSTVSSGLASADATASATKSVSNLTGTALPALLGSIASVVALVSDLLLMIYSAYELGHELVFSHKLNKAKEKGVTQEDQAKNIWKFFQKRVKVDVDNIHTETHLKNEGKSVKELRLEISKLHKRLIPFNLKFDRALKKELFEGLESHVEQMLATTKGLKFPEREQKRLLLNYMVLLESEIQHRKVDKHLAFHTGTAFVDLVHQYEDISHMGPDSTTKILEAYGLIRNESIYKKTTLSIAVTLSVIGLTAALLAMLVTFCPGLIPSVVILIMETTSAGGFLLYAAQTIVYKVKYDTFNEDVKKVFEEEELKRKLRTSDNSPGLTRKKQKKENDVLLPDSQ